MRRTTRTDEALRKRIGAAIERRRVARGIGVEALAQKADVDTSHMMKILAGAAGASIYSLERIAKALDWTSGELHTAAESTGRRHPSHA